MEKNEALHDSHMLQWLGQIRHVALDMDGTIYNGSTLFPFTLGFLNQLKQWGIGYSFLTNNPSKSMADYLRHLADMGIPATASEFYTSAQATIDYLHAHHPDYKRLFLLGTPSMIKEFEEAGFVSTADDAADVPDAVIVSFDKSLVYSRLCRAAWWIAQQLPYIATNPDRVCPTDQPTVLVDCGSICAALEHATGRHPDLVIGKPDPRMLHGIMERHHLQAGQVAMIGDRIYTDVKMAQNAHALGVLVLSGETTYQTAISTIPNPDLILKDLTEFQELLAAARKG